jgi:hypothetical protein
MKARYLKGAILEELRQNIPNNLERYRSGSFEYLRTDFSNWFEGTFDLDENQLSRLHTPDASEQHDEEHCARCYRALSGLSPYEARDERFWVYLTHTILLDYTRKRWPIPEDDALAIGHIRTHFFAHDKRQIERDNAASRLWWMARLCQRVSGIPLEDCLEVLLYRSDVRANIIERPTVSLNSVVFGAIIRKLHISYRAQKKLFERICFRGLMRRINSIGGVKLLECMTEDQLGALIDEIISSDLRLGSV